MASPQDVPQQGAPAPAPQQGQGDQGQGGGDAQSGAASQIVNGLGQGLEKFQEMLTSSQSVSADEKQLITQIVAMWNQLVDSLQGGSEEQGEAPEGDEGVSTPEAQGKKVQPAM